MKTHDARWMQMNLDEWGTSKIPPKIVLNMNMTGLVINITRVVINMTGVLLNVS